MSLKIKCKNLNITAIKLLEENTEVNFYDLGFSNGFFNTTPKTQATKGKKDTLDFITL